jgi:hypothetical protein
VPATRQILMKREFSRKILEKYSNINFHETRRVVSSGRSDRHDERNGRFSQFGERA